MKEIETLIRWLEIKKKYENAFPNSIDDLRINIYNSALLKRMLGGKDPFPIPPPTYYSHPWYSLIENKTADINGYDFFFPELWQHKLYSFPFVMIAQFPWEVCHKYSEDKYRITYWYQEDKKDLQVPGEWIFYKIKDDPDQEKQVWRIEK